MPDVYKLICDTLENNNYTSLFGISSSSSAMCLTNILHQFSIFKLGLVVNGQIALNKPVVDEYKNKCNDVAIFDENKIPSHYDKKLLTPFDNISSEHHKKYLFYYNNSVSDTVYYKYIKNILHKDLHINIVFKNDNGSHHGYIASLLKSVEFLKNIKTKFDTYS
jgi:hypothetical protein